MDFLEAGSWYDGSMFKRFWYIYNPKSVVEALLCQDFSNYWTSTEVYDALKIYCLYNGVKTLALRRNL